MWGVRVCVYLCTRSSVHCPSICLSLSITHNISSFLVLPSSGLPLFPSFLLHLLERQPQHLSMSFSHLPSLSLPAPKDCRICGMKVPSPTDTLSSASLYHGCLPVFSPAKFVWLCYSQPQSITPNPLSWCAINPSLPLPSLLLPFPRHLSTQPAVATPPPLLPSPDPWEERTITTGPGRFPSRSRRAAFETRGPEYIHGETQHHTQREPSPFYKTKSK